MSRTGARWWLSQGRPAVTPAHAGRAVPSAPLPPIPLVPCVPSRPTHPACATRAESLPITCKRPRMGADWVAKSHQMPGKSATSTCDNDGHCAALNLAKRWFFGRANQVPLEQVERIEIIEFPGGLDVCRVYIATLTP